MNLLFSVFRGNNDRNRNYTEVMARGRWGGGGVLTPNFGRYVPRQSEKLARAPERAPRRAWKCGAPERALRAVLSLKMRGSGTSLSRFERENAGHRNELDPFWAWKCESPELPGRRGAKRSAEPAVGGDERVEIKEISKMMVSGTAKSAQKCKMVMLRNGFLGNLWKWYAPERKFRAENGGLSRGTYPICIHMEVPPPPPRGGGG